MTARFLAEVSHGRGLEFLLSRRGPLILDQAALSPPNTPFPLQRGLMTWLWLFTQALRSLSVLYSVPQDMDAPRSLPLSLFLTAIPQESWQSLSLLCLLKKRIYFC